MIIQMTIYNNSKISPPIRCTHLNLLQIWISSNNLEPLITDSSIINHNNPSINKCSWSTLSPFSYNISHLQLITLMMSKSMRHIIAKTQKMIRCKHCRNWISRSEWVLWIKLVAIVSSSCLNLNNLLKLRGNHTAQNRALLIFQSYPLTSLIMKLEWRTRIK